MNQKRTDGLVARAQFQEMVCWSARGWRPRPAGHRCQLCGGPLWGKVVGRAERYSCTRCGHQQQVTTR